MRWGLGAKALAALLAIAGHAAAEVRAGETVAFVACPIAQDLGPEADLCFFVEYRGERFSVLTQAFDSTGPMLRHRMLVEGVVTKEDRECGGLRLEGMTSALTEIALECNEVRPFDVRTMPAEAPDPKRARDLANRLRADPSLSVQPSTFAIPEFQGPAPTAWEMHYTFDSDRGDGPSLQALVALVQGAVRDKAPSIAVHGYRAAARLDSGEILEEPAGMARQRAQKVAGVIAGLGYPAAQIDVAWTEEGPPPDGRTDWKRRRVTATVAK